MIYVYALAYYCLEYTERFIDSIVANASEPIHLTILENRSERSSELESSILHRIEIGKVQTFIQFKDNLMLQAYRYGYQLNLPGEDSDAFVMVTDSDVLFHKPVDWIGEMRRAFGFSEVGIMGWPTDMSNFYDTPNKAFGELRAYFDIKYGFCPQTNFGGYFTCIRKQQLDAFMQTSLAIADAVLIGFIQQSGFITGRFEHEVYHQGWDAWRDYPDYFKLKLERHWDLSATFPPLHNYKITRQT